MAQLRELGWNDEAIYYVIMVVSLFNFYNRWITTSGVHPVSEEAHRLHGKRLALSGYEPKNRLAGIHEATTQGRNQREIARHKKRAPVTTPKRAKR